MSLEENKAVVRRFFEEAWDKNKVSVVDEIYSTDNIHHFGSTPGPLGPDQLRTMIKMWREAIPGVVQKVLSPGNTGYHQSRNRPGFSPFEYYPGLKHTLIGLIGLIPRHGAGKLTATLVVTSASLLALSTAPANATPSDGPIRNAAYSQCIDAPGGALNVRLKLVACSSSGTQQWEFIPTGAANTYVIRNRASGLCMEVNNGTSTPKETVDEFTCNGLASEQWVSEGLTLRHAGTNQCLDTVGGPGSQLMQYTCGQAAPANVQSWITTGTPSGRQISVSNEGSGSTTVFTVTGTGFTPNSRVVIKITAPNFAQVQFPETAGADGKFVSRHSYSCVSGTSLTVTAFEDANPQGTFANAVVTTCP